jgi:hypothetical protein
MGALTTSHSHPPPARVRRPARPGRRRQQAPERAPRGTSPPRARAGRRQGRAIRTRQNPASSHAAARRRQASASRPPQTHLREHCDREVALVDALVVRCDGYVGGDRWHRWARAGARPRRRVRGRSTPGRGGALMATTGRRGIAVSATSAFRPTAIVGIGSRRFCRARDRGTTAASPASATSACARGRTRRGAASSSPAGSPRRWWRLAPVRPTATWRW